MPLEIDERGVSRVLVPRRVERETVPLAAADVALGHQLRPGLREREVDVEEHRAKAHLVLQQPVHRLHLRSRLVAPARPRHRLRDRPALRALAVEVELRAQPVEAIERRRASMWPSSDERTIGATENSRSPASGFGSIDEPRLALRGEHVLAVQVLVHEHLLALGRRELADAAERGVAERWSGTSAVVLEPPSRPPPQAAEAVAAAPEPRQQLDEHAERIGMRREKRARLAALEQERVRSSSRASSRTAPLPSQRSSASASCSASRCGQKTLSTAGVPSARSTRTTWPQRRERTARRRAVPALATVRYKLATFARHAAICARPPVAGRPARAEAGSDVPAYRR